MINQTSVLLTNPPELRATRSRLNIRRRSDGEAYIDSDISAFTSLSAGTVMRLID